MYGTYMVIYDDEEANGGFVVSDWYKFRVGNEEERRTARENAFEKKRFRGRNNLFNIRPYKVVLCKGVEVVA